jgi:cytochrome c oxidase subunit II
MSSPPRTRPSTVALTAIAVGVDLIKAGDTFVTGLYPPQAVTSQGAAIRDLYTIVFLMSVAVFFVVEGLILWSVIRYHRKPGDDVLPAQVHGNNIAEAVWTIVPTVIVAFLFIVSWQTLNVVDTTANAPQTHLHAQAGQFQWSFDYLADDGKTVLYTQLAPVGPDGGLNVPTGRTIEMTLNSNDVIHAFYVPQFLFKRDVVPGRTNKFQFNVDESMAGQTFRGQCAELCGAGHDVMLFDVHAMKAKDFDAWLTAAAAAAPPPAPSGSTPPTPSGSTPPAPAGSTTPAPSGSTPPASGPPSAAP